MMNSLRATMRGILASFALMLMAVPGTTQTSVDPTQLETLFQRAETLLEQSDPALSALEDSRDQIETQRNLLRSVGAEDSIEARALQAQLEALGPLPADGTTEADATAQRRQALLDAIVTANAPVQAAREALTRSDVILQELDARIRDSGNRELLRRLPGPLFPSTWMTAGPELAAFWSRMGTEVAERLARPDARGHLVSATPIAVALFVFAMVLFLFVVPRLSDLLLNAADAAASRTKRTLLLATANFAVLVLPAVAAFALILILPVLDIVPASLPRLPVILAGCATILVLAHWLSVTLFGRRTTTARPVDREAAHLTRLLGVVVMLELLVELQSRQASISDATTAALTLPVVAFAALLLWRIARLLLEHRSTESSAPSYRADAGLVHFLARGIQIAAVLALAMALFGYVNLARTIIVPVLLTLALVGLALFLYRAILRGIAAITTRDEDDDAFEGSLIPIGVIVVLTLCLAPLLAIVWGARAADVIEVWRVLVDGIVIGEMRLSLDGLIVLILVFLIGTLATRWLQRLLRMTVLPRTRLDSGAQSALNTGVGYLGISVSALLAVSAAGLNLSSLAVVVGALSVGIGLGLQNIVSNFVSGIILLIERPIKEGDWIEVSGKTGIVRKIAVRSTRIETFDRHDVIVPNLDLISGTVTNFTLTTPTGRLVLPIGIAYGSDVEQARDIILGCSQAHRSVLTEPEPSVLFVNLGDSALEFQLTCFVDDESRSGTIRSDLLFAIHADLQKAGIEIPFPQHDIRLRDIDALVKAIGARKQPG